MKPIRPVDTGDNFLFAALLLLAIAALVAIIAWLT